MHQNSSFILNMMASISSSKLPVFQTESLWAVDL